MLDLLTTFEKKISQLEKIMQKGLIGSTFTLRPFIHPTEKQRESASKGWCRITGKQENVQKVLIPMLTRKPDLFREGILAKVHHWSVSGSAPHGHAEFLLPFRLLGPGPSDMPGSEQTLPFSSDGSTHQIIYEKLVGLGRH